MTDLDKDPKLYVLFTYALLKRVDNTANINRFYYLAWQLTPLEGDAVIEHYRRCDDACLVLATLPFAASTETWSQIGTILYRRLHHGYRLMAPHNVKTIIEQYQSGGTKRPFCSVTMTDVNPMQPLLL